MRRAADGLAHGVGHPSIASAPRHSMATPQARRMRGLRRDAERAPVAETVSEAHHLPLGFHMARSEIRIHALGRVHIGGTAYFLWALPPNVGATAQRHVQFRASRPLRLQRQQLVASFISRPNLLKYEEEMRA